MVGSVRWNKPNGQEGEDDESKLFKSVSLCAAGRCRLDPRWHKVSDYSVLYLKHPALRDLPVDPNTVCFWATENIELLDLHEREEGRDENNSDHWNKNNSPSSLDSFCQEEPKTRNLKHQQAAFTFRVDLPADIPHSLSASSCRYFYAVIVRLELNDYGNAATNKPLWLQVPFTVLTRADFNSTSPSLSSVPFGPSGGRVQLGTSQSAVAHSSGFSCPIVTATELHQIEGQLTVHRHGAALFRRRYHGDLQYLQTMRVADPSGRPVGILTMIGANMLYPGSRLTLKFDYPKSASSSQFGGNDNKNSNLSEWLPCYQVSACLQGEEFAIQKDGTRRRARTHHFQTAHEIVDDCTECACLNLLLPVDAPCSVRTDVLEISVVCLIDIIVEATTQQGKDPGFRNLRLEIPCRVQHAALGSDCKEEEDEVSDKVAFPLQNQT